MKPKALTLLIAISACFLTSCATIQGRKQRLKVNSSPSAATVLYEGVEVGQTPSFIEVPRKKRGHLTFRFADGTTVEKPLESKYRWGDSFFSNFIWLFWGAPIGWGIDFLTGSSWNYQDVPPISLPHHLDSSKKVPATPPQKVIALAPPQGTGNEVMTEELGVKLNQIVNQHYPHAEVLPYLETDSIFHAFSYNSNAVVKKTYRNNLYYELHANHILESTSERKEQGVLLKARLTDIYSDQEIDHFSELVPYEELNSIGKNSFLEFLGSFVSIIPNTVFVDISYSTMNFIQDDTIQGPPFKPVSEKQDALITYLSAVAFRNSRSPKLDKLHGVFRLIPDLNFYFDRFKFDREKVPNPIQNSTFKWYSLALGFGPELGLESPFGYFYFDIIPSFAMNWISGPNHSSSLGTFELNVELGYQVFLSSRITLKLFARGITGPAGQWSRILSDTSQERVSLQTVAHGIYGIGIGYYLPDFSSMVRKAFY